MSASGDDVVCVIRCRECALRSEHGLCYKHGHGVADDFFCACGTRERPQGWKAKRTEKENGDICMATGRACSRCVPGPCDRRKEP